MLLSLENVKKEYKDFQLDCSLQVKEGQVTGMIGANGAGKSTTFKAILGLIKTDGGTIRVFEKDPLQWKASDKEKIGVVFAESTFSCMMTVKDVIAVMKASYHQFDEPWFLEKCRQYQLPLDKKIKDFSTGMKAKLKLLTAMSYDVKLLVLDEPTVGLDPMTREELLDEMRLFMERGNRAILISSHISTDIEGLCDDLYFMQDGTIRLHEDTDVILSDYAVIKVNPEQYENLDLTHVLYRKKEAFGYELLTRERQYYQDNYPDLVIEKGSVDGVLTLIAKGERV